MAEAEATLPHAVSGAAGPLKRADPHGGRLGPARPRRAAAATLRAALRHAAAAAVDQEPARDRRGRRRRGARPRRRAGARRARVRRLLPARVRASTRSTTSATRPRIACTRASASGRSPPASSSPRAATGARARADGAGLALCAAIRPLLAARRRRLRRADPELHADLAPPAAARHRGDRRRLRAARGRRRGRGAGRAVALVPAGGHLRRGVRRRRQAPGRASAHRVAVAATAPGARRRVLERYTEGRAARDPGRERGRRAVRLLRVGVRAPDRRRRPVAAADDRSVRGLPAALRDAGARRRGRGARGPAAARPARCSSPASPGWCCSRSASMPPAERDAVQTGAAATAIAPCERRVSGWGGGGGGPVELRAPGARRCSCRRRSSWCRARGQADAGAIARGHGAQLRRRRAARRAGWCSTRPAEGVRARPRAAGPSPPRPASTIGELLDALVPAGWMVPVVPGTQHVTVGGAIASDIHGKNHGADGTFGSHVEALGLLTAAGEVLELGAGDPELFEATLGGMGLTGRDRVGADPAARGAEPAAVGRHRPRRRRSTTRSRSLSRAGRPPPGRVARSARRLGPARGIVTRAEHLPRSGRGARRVDGVARPSRRARDRPAHGWPAGLLRPATVRAFNELRFRRAPRRASGRRSRASARTCSRSTRSTRGRGCTAARGFVQYQLVVPYGAERVLEAGDRAAAPRAGAVLPGGAQGLRGRQRRAAVVPDRGLDARARPPARRRRARRRCSTASTSSSRRPAAASTWPRTRGCGPRRSRRCTRGSTSGAQMRDRADPERLWRSDLALRTGLVAPRLNRR